MSTGDDGVDLDLCNRLAGNLRRMLESVGLERRPKQVEGADSAIILEHFRRGPGRPPKP